eukprot:g68890.t1
MTCSLAGYACEISCVHFFNSISRCQTWLLRATDVLLCLTPCLIVINTNKCKRPHSDRQTTAPGVYCKGEADAMVAGTITAVVAGLTGLVMMVAQLPRLSVCAQHFRRLIRDPAESPKVIKYYRTGSHNSIQAMRSQDMRGRFHNFFRRSRPEPANQPDLPYDGFGRARGEDEKMLRRPPSHPVRMQKLGWRSESDEEADEDSRTEQDLSSSFVMSDADGLEASSSISLQENLPSLAGRRL